MSLKSKVALINPGTSTRFTIQEPLNLAFIAAYLEKNGVEVKIFDQLAGDNVKAGIDLFRPDLAGVTSTTPVIYEAYELADYCRSKNILTAMGGVHPWIFPEEAKEHCDIVVRGEGEKVMLDIVEGKAKGPIIEAGFIANIEDLPHPARHLVNMERYLYCKKYSPYILHLPYVSARKKIVHMLTSRGCPHSECVFCHNSFKRFPYRANSAAKVIDEIKLLKKDFGVEAVYFVEDDFWADIERVAAISELMIKEGLNDILWGASARVEQINVSSPDLLNLAKKAGLRSVTIGFETGSQKTADSLKKSYKIEESYVAAEKVRNSGLIIHGNFIVGAPGEKLEDVEKTRKFIKKAKIVAPEIYVFTPYPGSVIWSSLEKQGKVPENPDWKTFNQEISVMNTSEIPLIVLNSLRSRMYIEYYASHPIRSLKLMFDMIMHPKSSIDKLINTLWPMFSGIFSRKEV